MLDLSNKSILVTGGSGFIGSNFIEYVLDNFENVRVVNIDKLGLGSRDLKDFRPDLISKIQNIDKLGFGLMDFKPNTASRIQNFELDVRFMNDMYLFYFDLPHIKYDYVFHFAAESHVDRSIDNPESFVANNVLGMCSLLEYCRRSQPQARIINVSSDEVFGHLNLNDDPFTEKSNLRPRSPYSASKASADLIAGSYYSTYGMDIITTRCCNNYGPHQHSEKFIPTVIRSLKNKERIPVYGTGENIREWIHVYDHNKSLLEIADIGRSGMTYNIGSGIEKTNLDLINDIIKLGNFGGSIEDHIKFVYDRKGHDFRYAISSLYYNREFEMSDYEQSLTETIKFYLK
jgi:dTDP-glucose 4,6-dehydratase